MPFIVVWNNGILKQFVQKKKKRGGSVHCKMARDQQGLSGLNDWRSLFNGKSSYDDLKTLTVKTLKKKIPYTV